MLDDCFKNLIGRFEAEIVQAHDPKLDPNMLLSFSDKYKETLANYLHFSQGNPLRDYVEMLTYDIREARALLEAI